MNINIAACATAVLLSFSCLFAAVAEEVPTLHYKVDIDSNGQVIVQKIGSDPSLSVTGNAETAFWVIMNSEGRFIEAAPAGTVEIVDKLAMGDKLQVISSEQYFSGIFSNKPTLAEMEQNIRAQIRSAVKAFKIEACELMSDWDTVKFSFEVGADSFVVAKLNASGSFTPSKIC